MVKRSNDIVFRVARKSESKQNRATAGTHLPHICHMLLLRPWQTGTHCCGHIVADTNVSPFARARNVCCGHKFCVRDTKNVSDFVPKHFVSATNVSQFAHPKKHHGQQCVRNNVSSFARAFTSTIYPNSFAAAYNKAYALF